MKTYIVIFDLGIYKMTYSPNIGFTTSSNDSFTDYEYRKVADVFQYMTLENSNKETSLSIHNDSVISSYLGEYTSYLNIIVKNKQGKVVPLLVNCFAINFDGTEQELLALIAPAQKYRFIQAVVLPLEKIASNVSRETLLQFDYLQQQSSTK